MPRKRRWEQVLQDLGRAAVGAMADELESVIEEQVPRGRKTRRVGRFEWPVPPGEQVVSPYQVLGCAEDAPWEVVVVAHRALAKKYHPDGQTPDPAKAKTINEAFAAIKKAQKKTS